MRTPGKILPLLLLALFSQSALPAEPPRAPAPNEQFLEDAPLYQTSAIADHAANIYIGTENNGLWQYNPATKKWLQFTSKDGLGDDSIFALLADKQGRIWAGHLNHGLSVFNGKSWKNFPNFGPSAGPLGMHVTALAQNPVDDEIWIASEAGLSRYSDQSHAWKHITRAQGLPEDQTRGLAFDHLGNLYVALATQGLAIAHPKDDYATWTHITGPDAMPETASGKGLPGNLANAVAVDPKDHIFLATTRGLASSSDLGKTWTFLRGKNWQLLVNGQHRGESDFFQSKDPGALNEDWVTTLQPDNDGSLWVGFRETGYQRLDAATLKSQLTADQGFPAAPSPDGTKTYPPVNNVTALLVRSPLPTPLICRYTSPPALCTNPKAKLIPLPIPPVPAPAALPDFPTPAAPLKPQELHLLSQKILALKPATTGVAYLGEDWVTQGNWVGRYGKTAALLFALPHNFGTYGDLNTFHITTEVGLTNPRASLYTYFTQEDFLQPRRVLYSPTAGKRISGEVNDATFQREALPRSIEGPGLWLHVQFPEGVHQLSLYFGNTDAHAVQSQLRDYILEVHAAGDNPGDIAQAEQTPVLATARVSQFWGGVYQRFLFNGPGEYWIRLRRNHSYVTKFYAVFIDTLAPLDPETPPKTLDDPPPLKPLPDSPPLSPELQAALNLHTNVEKSWDRPGIELLAHQCQLEAYRTAEAAHAPENLKSNWRHQLPLWTPEDDTLFTQRMNPAPTP